MSVKAQVQAPFRSHTYTKEEIDEYLVQIGSLLKLRPQQTTRKQLVRRANQWLDRRNELFKCLPLEQNH